MLGSPGLPLILFISGMELVDCYKLNRAIISMIFIYSMNLFFITCCSCD